LTILLHFHVSAIPIFVCVYEWVGMYHTRH